MSFTKKCGIFAVCKFKNQNTIIMSEEIIPDVEMTSDVAEKKSLADIVKAFEELIKSEERMKMSKEAEALKASFYRMLGKEKAEMGESAEGAFDEIENVFKEMYNAFKKEKAEYNRRMEQEATANLALKEAIIADLKALIEKQEDVNETFPQLREIQDRWRAVGPVPPQNYRNINETYQLYIEQFYDMVSINRELRDLDFKKNLEAKEQLCAQAEELASKSDVVAAFRELQKLHEEWKEYGPVAKEFRESVWERFKTATAVINKAYQAHFEGLKEQFAENLAKKSVLCEKVEEIAAREVADLNQWNAFSKEIEDIQAEWKTIGFASRKDNQKVYDRFRAACDSFYSRKREYYLDYKNGLTANLERKTAICEEAEALKTSTDWKKTADRLIALQKEWKEIGAVPRKKAEALWKRFRAACDEFFAERDKQAKPENDFYGNLKAKQRLIEEIKAYELAGDESDAAALAQFQARWNEIGFVPFKEKDNVGKAYKEAISRFPSPSRGHRRDSRRAGKPQISEKERLIQKYHALEQDIVTYENNIGFFSMSKNAQPLIMQLQEKIEKSKEDLKALAEQIKALNESETKE